MHSNNELKIMDNEGFRDFDDVDFHFNGATVFALTSSEKNKKTQSKDTSLENETIDENVLFCESDSESFGGKLQTSEDDYNIRASGDHGYEFRRTDYNLALDHSDDGITPADSFERTNSNPAIRERPVNSQDSKNTSGNTLEYTTIHTEYSFENSNRTIDNTLEDSNNQKEQNLIQSIENPVNKAKNMEEFSDQNESTNQVTHTKSYTNESLDIDKTIGTSRETRDPTYSDGYFDQSIERIYERYNKSQRNKTQSDCADTSCDHTVSQSRSSDEQPTGCFDDMRETQNQIDQMSFFRRCTQKKYIVLSSTALCMIVATALAVVLTVNVFHVTGTNRHYHGDASKTAETSAEMYQKATIASDSGNCSRVGIEILRKNGSAVDGAVATAFCLGVTNRHASGIGGGGYMLVYIRENKTFEAFDFRETAPGRIKSGVYDKDNNASRHGGLAIGVPGEVRGLYTAWKKYGKLPWKDLLQPAIDMAKYGVAVTPSVHNIITKMSEMFQADRGLSKLLLNSNGEPLEVGANMIDEELAKTLEVISQNPEDFYTGELAAKIVADVTEAGGIISFDDLANYRVLNQEVVHDSIDDLDLHTIGAPTGGPVVISILNILKGYKLKREDIETKCDAALTYHRIIEAIKFGFGMKSKEGDPTFNKEYMKELVNNMTNEDIGTQLRRRINDSTTQGIFYYDSKYHLPNENGTSHISLVAENGDAVSLTTTINEWYGSLNRSLKTGIIYNNEMNDFSMVIQQPNTQLLPPSPMNSVHSSKRPVSSTSPIIMVDVQGNVRFVIGATGGLRIIPAITQVIMNVLWFKDDLGNALSRPRVYTNLEPATVYVEEGLEHIVKELQKRNHTVEIVGAEELSAVQAVYVVTNGLYAKSDRRKSGHTAGY